MCDIADVFTGFIRLAYECHIGTKQRGKNASKSPRQSWGCTKPVLGTHNCKLYTD